MKSVFKALFAFLKRITSWSIFKSNSHNNQNHHNNIMSGVVKVVNALYNLSPLADGYGRLVVGDGDRLVLNETFPLVPNANVIELFVESGALRVRFNPNNPNTNNGDLYEAGRYYLSDSEYRAILVWRDGSTDAVIHITQKQA